MRFVKVRIPDPECDILKVSSCLNTIACQDSAKNRDPGGLCRGKHETVNSEWLNDDQVSTPDLGDYATAVSRDLPSFEAAGKARNMKHTPPASCDKYQHQGTLLTTSELNGVNRPLPWSVTHPCSASPSSP